MHGSLAVHFTFVCAHSPRQARASSTAGSAGLYLHALSGPQEVASPLCASAFPLPLASSQCTHSGEHHLTCVPSPGSPLPAGGKAPKAPADGTAAAHVRGRVEGNPPPGELVLPSPDPFVFNPAICFSTSPTAGADPSVFSLEDDDTDGEVA